jgi:hypothetical protein
MRTGRYYGVDTVVASLPQTLGFKACGRTGPFILISINTTFVLAIRIGKFATCEHDFDFIC